jgi:hypothetical protein
VHEWLTCHPRWTFHFTPASTPWRNAEGILAKLTRRRLKRGVFRYVADLRGALNRFRAEIDSLPDPSSGPWPPNAHSSNAATKLRIRSPACNVTASDADAP